MATKKKDDASQEETTAEQFRITLKEGEKIRHAGLTMRADRSHVVSAAVREEYADKIDTAEAI